MRLRRCEGTRHGSAGSVRELDRGDERESLQPSESAASKKANLIVLKLSSDWKKDSECIIHLQRLRPSTSDV